MFILISACLISGCETIEQKRTREKMANIIIPEVDFRQANVYDVMMTVVEMTHEFDHKTKKGPSGSLGLCSPTKETIPDETLLKSQYPSVTFNAHNISLLDALNAISRISGIKYTIDKKGIIQIERRSNNFLKGIR